MNIGNQEVIFCADDDYRVFCEICDELCTERFYKNHLKSQTHTNNNRKMQQLKKWFQIKKQNLLVLNHRYVLWFVSSIFVVGSL